MSGKGLVASLFNRVSNAMSRRQLVGTDFLGNNFYRKVEVDLSGSEFERRTMVPADRGNHSSYNPLSVPAQWRQWLSKTREDPPTEEEMQQDAVRVAQLQMRVTQLNAEEHRRRLRAQSLGEEPEMADAQPSMDRFVGQLTGKTSFSEDLSVENSGGKGQQERPSKRAFSKDFEPDTWQPGG